MSAGITAILSAVRAIKRTGLIKGPDTAISARLAGTEGFWSMFWTGYTEMIMVSISDFLILDCWLPGKVRRRIKGAEHCKAWERKEWLIKLAIPEHFLGWPLLICPLEGLIAAGIGMIIR